jgi:hypothetical protein
VQARGVAPLAPAALVFVPGRDADARRRELAFPDLAWEPAPRSLPALAALAEGLGEAPPRDLDSRLRAVIAFLQTPDLEAGGILRQTRDRGLFNELGFASLARYAEERLDVPARTTRRLVALARAGHRPWPLRSAPRRRWPRSRPSCCCWACGPEAPPPTRVPALDLERCLGTWYEMRATPTASSAAAAAPPPPMPPRLPPGLS